MKKTVRRPWTFPLALLAVGIGLFLGSIGWAVATGVAIPDPDPTPAMQTHAALHGQIVSVLMGGGVLLFVVALVWLGVVFFRRRGLGRAA
jgi:hypothetical protein